MPMPRRKYDTESKKNAVKLSYASPKPIKEVADDLGVSESMLYRWRQRYTAQGERTQTATLEEELKVLRIENAELKMERDMLKKPRPTLQNYRSKIWFHSGTSGVSGYEVGRVPGSVAQRLLRVEENTW